MAEIKQKIINKECDFYMVMQIKKEEKIGIMAGASTPQKSIEEVEKYLNGL